MQQSIGADDMYFEIDIAKESDVERFKHYLLVELKFVVVIPHRTVCCLESLLDQEVMQYQKMFLDQDVLSPMKMYVV